LGRSLNAFADVTAGVTDLDWLYSPGSAHPMASAGGGVAFPVTRGLDIEAGARYSRIFITTIESRPDARPFDNSLNLFSAFGGAVFRF
jgi:hypothetical protein